MSASDRPLSPHLQIYRPQLTTILSITHRATGVALAVGTLLLTCWLISAALGPANYTGLQRFLASWLGILLLLGWSWSLFYHLCNGIRHLVWDTGHWLDLKGCYASGYGVLIVSTALTAIAWIAGFTSLGHS
jgi:succinate dehydrogenase / fumarate reductase, cytochrome b subunit